MVSDSRRQQILAFSAVVRDAGAKLGPKVGDAERIRLIAHYLQAGEPAVRTWWYAYNCPRGGSAVAIQAQLARLELSTGQRIELHVPDVSARG